MLRRIVWFTIGTGVGVLVVLKARDYLRRATPAAVQDRMGQAAVGMGDRISAFVADARAAMAEREAELRDTLGLGEARDPDLDTRPRRAAPDHTAPDHTAPDHRV